MGTKSRRNPVATRTTFLQTMPLFAQLTTDQVERIAEDVYPRTYKRHAVIFNQDDTSQEVYIVRSGKVRIYRCTPGGNETSINLFCPGDILGEFAVIDQQPRSATAVAITTCVVWEMAGADFLKHLRAVPELALALSRLLVQKLRWTAAYAETVAQYDAAGRLLHMLLLYNSQIGEVIEPGKQSRLDLALTQDDLASLVGARREWVNRLLQEWRRKSLLSFEGGQFIFLDLPKVEEERDRHLEGATIPL